MVNFVWDNIFRRAEKEKDVAVILGENFLFQDLTRKELKFVENIVHVRHFRPGETIFREGEVGVGMYIVTKGSVNITMSSMTENGDKTRPVFITRLIMGDFFGELSLVEENSRRSATATAHEETTVIGFFKPDLMEILERSPATGVKVVFRLAEILGRRLKETTDKVSQLRKELKFLREQAEAKKDDENKPRPSAP